MNTIIAKLLSVKNSKLTTTGQILPTSVTPLFLKQFFTAWLKNTQSQSGKLSGGVNNPVSKIEFKSSSKDSHNNSIKHFSFDGIKPKNSTQEIVKALSVSNINSKKLVATNKQHAKIITSVKPDREPENVSLNCQVRKTTPTISENKLVSLGTKEKKLRGKAETGGHDGVGQAVELTHKVPISKGIKTKTAIQIGTTANLDPKYSKIPKPTGKAESSSNSIAIETKKPALVTPTDNAQTTLTNSVKSTRRISGSQNSPFVPPINKQDVRLGSKVTHQPRLKQSKVADRGKILSGRTPKEVKAFPNNSSPVGSKQSQQVEPPINRPDRHNSAVREQSPIIRTGIKVNSTDQHSTPPDTPLNHSVNRKGTVTSATAATRPEAHSEQEVNKVDNPRVDSKPVPPAPPERPRTESNNTGKQIKPGVTDNNPGAVKANIEAVEIKRTVQAAYGSNPVNQSVPAEIAVENRPAELSDNRSRGRIQYTVANESVAGSDANQPVQMRSLPNPVPVSMPRIVQQIVQTIIDSNSGTTTQTSFRVDGGNLGTMQIQFQNEAGQNQATIVVESENARLIVQKLLSDITESLTQKGIVLTSLDVRIGHEQRKNGNSAGRPNRGNRRNINNDDESQTIDDSPLNKTDLRDYGYNTIEVLA